MRIFKTRFFQKWMKKTELTDNLLHDAVIEMSRGLVDAELGGEVVKKRIAFPYRGKSGSTRTIVATNHDDKWFFLFGFEKNERENITDKEFRMFRVTAAKLLKLDETQLSEHIVAHTLEEVHHGKKK